MTFRGSGDAGDLFFSLAIAHACPDGPHAYYLVDRPGITAPITPRFKIIAPLIQAQPYIKECKLSEKPVDCDFVSFRHFHNSTQTLLRSHLMEFQLETDKFLEVDGSEPWLTADPSPKTEGRIVIARSPRYNNNAFPWKKVVKHYGKRLLFVGLPKEHENFVASFGWVEYQPTKNLLEVAELIAGADYFIGNQSSPMSIAIGLGNPFAQEVCLSQPDCVYRRANAQYVTDGTATFPDVDGSGELVTMRPEPDVSGYSRSNVPPGMWQYPNLPSNPNFQLQKNLVKTSESCNDEIADELLMRHNVKRCPSFFEVCGTNEFELFRTAYAKAFGPQPITQST